MATPTYYELHREEMLRKQRERRLRKAAERPPEEELRNEINKLQSKVNRLEEQVEYYKNLAAKLKQAWGLEGEGSSESQTSHSPHPASLLAPFLFAQFYRLMLFLVMKQFLKPKV